MKITLSSWGTASLLLASIMVGKSLYRTWLQSDREMCYSSCHLSGRATLSTLWNGDAGSAQAVVREDERKTGGGTIPVCSSSGAFLSHAGVSRSVNIGEINVSSGMIPEGASGGVPTPPVAPTCAVKAISLPSSQAGTSAIAPSLSALSGTAPKLRSESSTNSPQNIPARGIGANIPAAFGNPSVLGNLSDAQKAQISQIANDFSASVQSSGVAPNTPEYQQVWDTAAYRADEIFRGQFGIPAFNAMQISRGYQQ